MENGETQKKIKVEFEFQCFRVDDLFLRDVL